MAQPRSPFRLQLLLMVLALVFGTGCPSGKSSLEGHVLGADGSGVANVQVAVVGSKPGPSGRVMQDVTWTTTDPQGRFRVQLPPGSYQVSGTHPVLGGASSGPVDLRQGQSLALPRPLRLAPDAGQVEGQVEGPQGEAVDAVALFVPITPEYRPELERALITRVVAGHLRVALPSGLYRCVVQDPRYTPEERWVEVREARQSLRVRLQAASSPAPRAVQAYIRAKALPLATCDLQEGVADLEPVAALFGQARVVGLGEATHGTREFARLKQRIMDYLARTSEFTLFAVEINLAGGFVVDDFIRTGVGDPWPAVPSSLHTAEFREWLLWLRRFNEDPAHARKIRFYGFDMSSTQEPCAWARTYLRRVAPAEAALLEASLGGLGALATTTKGPVPGPDRIQAWQGALAKRIARADACRRPWTARGGARDFERYRQCLVVLQQFTGFIQDRYEGAQSRERAMADNVQWILRQEPPGARMLLSAHNGHITKAPEGRSGYPPMGFLLKQALGRQYLAFGLAFGHGRFGALNEGPGGWQPVTYPIDLEESGTLDQALASAGLPFLALDLRTLPDQGPVAQWFQAPQGTWSISLKFRPATPEDAIQEHPIATHFDGLLFVRESTPVTRLPLP